MSQIRILFDVTDLFALLEKDVAQIFYRLYQVPYAPNLLTPRDVLWHWVVLTLDEYDAIMFKQEINTLVLNDLGIELFNALRIEVHSAYRSLFWRLLRLPNDYIALEGELPVIEEHGNRKTTLTLLMDL